MKLIHMSDYNRAAKTYWCVMVVAGAAVFAWTFVQAAVLTPLQWAEFAGLLSLVILTSANPIRIPNTNSSFTAGDTFTFLAILFLGVPPAIIIGCVDSFVSSRRTSKRMSSWIGAPAMMALSVFVAGNAFYFVLQRFGQLSQNPIGLTSIPSPLLFAGIGLMALLHYFINGFTVSTLYALKTRNPILKFWHDGYLWPWSSFLAAAIATGVVYAALARFGLAYVLL